MPIIQVPSTLGVGVMIISGAGTPEGVQTAGMSSLYLQSDAASVWRKTTATGNTGWVLIGSSGSGIVTGTGSPEGVVTAVIGSLYGQTDAASGKAIWFKNTGIGNTGWRLLQAARQARTTPTLAAGNNNNYDAVIDEGYLRLVPDAAGSTITGIAGGVSLRRLRVVNIGGGDVTFTHQDPASSAANRFVTPTTGPVVLNTLASADIEYDGTGLGWRFVGYTIYRRTLLTFATIPTFNFNEADTIRLGDLVGNVTGQVWQFPMDGRLKVVMYRQDATGGRTVAAPANALGFGTVSAAPNSLSVQNFVYDATLAKFVATAPMITGM